ncbi:MAG TPA: hypothetical protein VN493_08700 [Thermoanaerobaculia bacterium]|nr:hypothetical protein [Thermoanaerobaculia bacterium]
MDQDLDHLKLLSIFHYVLAVVVGLFACLPLLHVFLGISMAFGTLDGTDPGDAFSMMMGWFIAVFAAGFVVAGWALAVCLALAGSYLARRVRYNFCLVVAAVSCVFMPLGTALGIFTILVLMRPSVKALFEGAPRSSPGFQQVP